MNVIEEMKSAIDALAVAPADLLVGYLVNDEGFANLQKYATSKSSINPIDINSAGAMTSRFSGVPIHHFSGLAHSVCLFADGSTKPMLT